MLLGGFGGVIFQVSSRSVHSYQDLKVTTSGRWAQHDVHLELPVLEFTGPGLLEVSFKMNFNTSWGAPPLPTIALLREYCRLGIVAPLVTGGRPIASYGFNLFVCKSVGETHKYYDGRGQLFGAEVDVTLSEYRIHLG